MPVCVNIHVVAFPKIKKGRSGEILNIYLHVVNNQKLYTVPLMHAQDLGTITDKIKGKR